MDCPVESAGSINCHTSSSCSEMGVIVNPIEKFQNAIFLRCHTEKSTHKSMSSFSYHTALLKSRFAFFTYPFILIQHKIGQGEKSITNTGISFPPARLSEIKCLPCIYRAVHDRRTLFINSGFSIKVFSLSTPPASRTQTPPQTQAEFRFPPALLFSHSRQCSRAPPEGCSQSHTSTPEETGPPS